MSDELDQPSRARLRAYGLTSKGRVRQSNEDAYFCDPSAGVFVVCDGMGGAAAGEIASRLAADKAGALLAGGKISEERLTAAVAEANTAVFEHANSDRRLEGMGTTLVALAVQEQQAWIAHVGDSRCYRLREGKLERLTHDHSLVEEQVRLGQITRLQAERSPFQHVITRAVGTTAAALPDILKLDLVSGDLFLLASDGLTREMSEESIAAALRHATDDKSAIEALIEGANTAGGRDNITCLLVRIE